MRRNVKEVYFIVTRPFNLIWSKAYSYTTPNETWRGAGRAYILLLSGQGVTFTILMGEGGGGDFETE